MKGPLVDANVVLRFLLQDHPEHSPRATAFFRRVGSGDVRAYLSDSVIFESAFTLERSYKHPKDRVREAMVSLLDQRSLLIANRARWRRVFNLYVDYNIPLGDAMNVEFMERNGVAEIISFDKDFDRVPAITRIEP